MSMTMPKIESLWGITNTQEMPVLGYLVWYSISEGLISRDELLQKLEDAGLDERLMPNEIRASDAFRKATTAIEKKRVPIDKNIYLNIMCREISSDKDHIRRNIVFEYVNTDSKHLGYKSEEAILQLDKHTSSIDVIQCSNDAVELVDNVKANFRCYLKNYDSRAVRSMTTKILWGMNPIAVRPSGGVYFVPVKYEAELTKLVGFLSSFGDRTEGHKIPLVNSEEQRDMIRAKVKQHLNGTLDTLANALKNPKIDKANANIFLQSAKFTLENFKDYKETLNDELEDMNTTISLIQRQMFSLVEKITEIEVKKVQNK